MKNGVRIVNVVERVVLEVRMVCCNWVLYPDTDGCNGDVRIGYENGREQESDDRPDCEVKGMVGCEFCVSE